jgi:predicted AlkP superfamily phosphohydrolase/phosphomutase
MSHVMIHLGGFDNVCHAFWQYRFPGEYPSPPAAADVNVLGPVIDRYLEYLDGAIAQLIARFPKEPNVIVVSDHGHGVAPTDVVPWKGWHASPGLMIAAGPDIPHRASAVDASYYDIVPTVLDLHRFLPAADLRGASLLTAQGAAGRGDDSRPVD